MKTQTIPRLALHGGAGNFDKITMSNEEYSQRLLTMREALSIGYTILEEGGTAIDSTVATVVHLENSEYFNAGKSGALTWGGLPELDASIMEGATLNAGCVSNIATVKNPILLAKEILQSEHIFLTGSGAVEFAKERGLEIVDPLYFITDSSIAELQRVKKAQKVILGTVGAVAIDCNGNLASATSTGGIMNKRPGRVGDTPVIGSGTYADNTLGAISATGYGEYFLRTVAAYSILSRMKYLNESLEQSANEILQQIKEMGGSGGIIGITNKGEIALPYNTPGMQRGIIDKNGSTVGIFDEME